LYCSYSKIITRVKAHLYDLTLIDFDEHWSPFDRLLWSALSMNWMTVSDYSKYTLHVSNSQNCIVSTLHTGCSQKPTKEFY